MEIVLARHGRPKVNHDKWIAPREIADWIRDYDEGGIVVEEVPAGSRAKAEDCGLIVSSPLARCLQSAKVLVASREISTEDAFLEAGLPYIRWRSPLLPASVWSVIFRIAWFSGFSGNSESRAAAEARSRTAASRLVDLARAHGSVFLVGHGIMNAFIGKELIRQGWVGPKRSSHRYWQFGVYRK